MIGEYSLSEWIEALGNSEYEIRENAHKCLLSLGEIVIEPLIATTRNSPGRQSWEAARVLAQIEDVRVWQLMSELLNSTNVVLTQIAAQALGDYGEQSVPSLVKALSTSRELTQIEILSALERIGSPGVVVPLMEFLRTTPSSMLRYTAIQVLGKLGDPRAVELIRSFQDDQDHHVRKRVYLALQALNTTAHTSREI